MRKRVFMWMPVLLLVVLLMAGCTFVPIPSPPGIASVTVSEEPRADPFTSRTEGADGIINEWSGNATHHQPGDVSTFELKLENQSEVVWDGRYCLYLLSPQWLLQELASKDFVLEQGTARGQVVEVTFPGDLEPGGYGLALIIQRPAGHTIQLTSIAVGLPVHDRATHLTSIPDELVEVARAQCVPAAEAYATGMPPVGLEAEDTVRLFYWEYLQLALPDAEGRFINPLVEHVYRDSPYLAEGFVRQIDAMLEDEIRFDPFLCAQDVPKAFVLGGATITEDAIFVRVRTGLGNEFDVVVADQGDAWRIINVICLP